MYLKICHLYPNTLNLYGDRGNRMALKKRCQWRGIEVKVRGMEVGEEIALHTYDLLLIGGGQDSDQRLAIEDLKRRREELLEMVEEGYVILSICGGYQLLGDSYLSIDGEIEGLKILDIQTRGGTKRLTGNVVVKATCFKENFTLVGFENHGGKTYLGHRVEALGFVEVGYGNNGEDKTEGCRYKNTFGTYLHGPLLPKNPLFTDYLLSLALKRRYPEATLSPLDDTLEEKAQSKAQEVAVKKGKGLHWTRRSLARE